MVAMTIAICAHATRNDPRDGQVNEPLHVGGPLGPFQLEPKARPDRGKNDDGDLQQSGDGDTPGHGHAGDLMGAVPGRNEHQQHGDQHEVQNARGEGRDGESTERVEKTRIERDPRT